MQQSNRAPSPFRPPSPYQQSSPYHALHSLPTGPAQVGPGAITYKTSTGSDGRIVYEPYRAVAASYHTPSGVVSGIQWMKVEHPTSVGPPGVQPYANGVPGGWNASGQVPSAHEWQRTEENRRKHEEKVEAKRLREMETNGRNDPEYELKMARERDAQSTVNRDRRKSFNTGTQGGPAVTFPSMNGGVPYPIHPTQIPAYGTSPYSDYSNLHTSPGSSAYPSAMDSRSRSHSRNPSANAGYGDLTKQFKDFDIDRQNDYERDRKSSNPKRTRKYSTNEETYERARTISGNYVDRDAFPTAPGPYSTAPGPYANPQHQPQAYPTYPTNSYITPSPNTRAGDISYGATPSGYPMANNSTSAYSPPSNAARSTTPFGNPPPLQYYPRGHILEGQPIISSSTSNPRSRASSRAASPNSSRYSANSKSPHIPTGIIPGETQQLPAPEAFSRPINGSSVFKQFEAIKIQDMDEAYDTKLPKMPSVLATHDIYPEDWKRCMQDLQRSWTGQLPVPNFGKEQPRRSTLAADLIDLWNASFFFNRGVEMILYKGKERRTGRQAGLIDHHLPDYDDEDDYSSSSDCSTSDSEREYNRVSGPYGRTTSNQMMELQEARRRRHEEKKERRRRRKEKKARRRAKARDKSYSVYIVCLPQPAISYMVPAQPGLGGYGAMPTAAGGYTPSGGYATQAAYTPGYQPIGIPKTRSHGYGGEY
ncbi:hypothetical protein BDN70DRAFT_938634 [Pholiota conissans]|uniref:Uncharacterized protein n=1 Tax=Pholiota conissans TaxID=109636 RepID=A0A9P5YN16_9AGAR|nr:hypothetical protein BDN70DRAFT_938634 [Pholiota conissans]